MKPVPWPREGGPLSSDYAWAASWAVRSLKARMHDVPLEERDGYLRAILKLEGRVRNWDRVAEAVRLVRAGKARPVGEMEVVA